MDEVADMYDFAETEIIGQSYEGRDLKIIKICKGGCGNKPAIWLDGGMYLYEILYGIRKGSHSSEIRGLCLMKWPGETLQNLPYLINMKTQSLFRFSFHPTLFFPLMNY